MNERDKIAWEPAKLTRRQFLPAAALTATAGLQTTGAAPAVEPGPSPELPPALAPAVREIEPYFFAQEAFTDVSRGNPVPHSLPEQKRREVGLTRDTWRLEVITDPDQPASLGRQLTRKDGTALDFCGLLRLAEKHAVRFPKVMTCLNIGCPLGMGIWEGVPLREVIWLTQPRENLRRVMYFGYHNDDPNQLFRSTLPIGRVLEDPFDLPPVIVCYRLNGQWLDPRRGGPVRIVVPEAYGFKSVKWLTTVVLTNLAHAVDTYASGNNDIDSPLKTFAATLSVPQEMKPNTAIPVTGWAQAGICGLAKVQTWVQPSDAAWPADDPFFTRAPWVDARILAPPGEWGGDLPGGAIPAGSLGFDVRTGRPRTWPMRLCKAHWAALLPGRPAGEYTLRCRAIDEQGHAQPMPRPFRKSGRCDIQTVRLIVKA
jgi:DMSO/TMAO reductase YedYZ molybdopterin-dependent catalytic subunit